MAFVLVRQMLTCSARSVVTAPLCFLKKTCQRLSICCRSSLALPSLSLRARAAYLQFAEALQANVWSAFNVLKGSVKAMMKSKKGGSVALMSSSGLCLLQWLHLSTPVC